MVCQPDYHLRLHRLDHSAHRVPTLPTGARIQRLTPSEALQISWTAICDLLCIGILDSSHVDQWIQVFFPGKFRVPSFLAAYITLPIVIALYLGHKIWFKTPLLFRVHSIDVYTGKDEADRLEEMDVPPVPKNVMQKIWYLVLYCSPLLLLGKQRVKGSTPSTPSAFRVVDRDTCTISVLS